MPGQKLAAGGRSLDVTPLGLALKSPGKKSIVVPLAASTSARAFAPSPVPNGGEKTSQRPDTVTPVNGRTLPPPVSPHGTLKVPFCVTCDVPPPPIVNGCSPSRHVSVARMRPFVSLTQTFVPSEAVVCVAAYATPALSASTTATTAKMMFLLTCP